MAELALILPMILLMATGVYDIGTASSNKAVAAGAARAGLRAGQGSASADIGLSIRNEAQGNIPLTAGAWGSLLSSNCGTGSTTCGDSAGCAFNSAFWTESPKPQACFAVGSCTLAAGPPPSCPAPGAWGTRPATGGTLLVLVTVRLQPVAPGMAMFAKGGSFYATSTVYGSVTY